MCLIAVIPARAEVSQVETALRRIGKSWDVNSDGAGFAFAIDGKVRVRKPFYGKKQLVKALRRTLYRVALGNTDTVVHLRYATHGHTGHENVHPHVVGTDKRVVVAHNGIISGYGSAKPNEGDSDTVEFLRFYYSRIGYEDIVHPAVLAQLALDAGSWNKFALLGPDGLARIVNEKAGHWRDGVWYSAWVAEYETPARGKYGRFVGCGADDYYGRDYEWKSAKTTRPPLTIVPAPHEVVTRKEAESMARSAEAEARLNKLIDAGSGELAPELTRHLIEESEAVRKREALDALVERKLRLYRIIDRWQQRRMEEIEKGAPSPAAVTKAAEEADAAETPIDFTDVPAEEQDVAPATLDGGAVPEGARKLEQVGCPPAACARPESAK